MPVLACSSFFSPHAAEDLEDDLRLRLQSQDQLRIVLAAKLPEHGHGLELGVGQGIGSGIELIALGFDVVHGHHQLLALQVAEQAQAAGAGTDNPLHGIRNGHGAGHGIGDRAGLYTLPEKQQHKKGENESDHDNLMSWIVDGPGKSGRRWLCHRKNISTTGRNPGKNRGIFFVALALEKGIPRVAGTTNAGKSSHWTLHSGRDHGVGLEESGTPATTR
jgi:hypothetical protein